MVLSACQITGSIISSLAAYFGYRKPGENPTQTEQSKLEEKKKKKENVIKQKVHNCLNYAFFMYDNLKGMHCRLSYAALL